MKKFLKRNIGKKLIYIGIFAYILYVFIGQQRTLNSYKASQKYYAEKLDKQIAYQQSLNSTKDNIDSKEYIEKIAREKLDMYLPNERVYIDKGN